jgi:hypothetical protein
MNRRDDLLFAHAPRESLDSRLDNLWSDVEDAEIELEFDKQVTQMYFTKKISIRDYTKLKTSMSKQKGKEIIRERTHGKKPKRKSKTRALKHTVEEYLQEYFDGEGGAGGDYDAETTAAESTAAEDCVVEDENPEDLVTRNNSTDTSPSTSTNSTHEHARPERIEKLAKMKQKRELAKETAKGGPSGWGLFSFCCAAERTSEDA